MTDPKVAEFFRGRKAVPSAELESVEPSDEALEWVRQAESLGHRFTPEERRRYLGLCELTIRTLKEGLIP